MQIQLPHELTLPHVAEFMGVLRDAMLQSSSLELDASRLEEVDAAGMQLLCAAHRSAVERGVELRFLAGERGRCFEDALRRLGFARTEGCRAACLFMEPRHG